MREDLHFLPTARSKLATLHIRASSIPAQSGVAIIENNDLLRLVVVGRMALLVHSTSEVSCSTTMSGASRNESKGQGGVLESRRLDLEHSENARKNKWIDPGLSSRLASGAAVAVRNQIALKVLVEEEAIIGSKPQRLCGIGLRLTLERVCEVDRVREVHGPLGHECLEEVDEDVLVGVMDLAFAHGKDLGRSNFVNHMALEAAHGLSLCDDDDIFIYICQ